MTFRFYEGLLPLLIVFCFSPGLYAQCPTNINASTQQQLEELMADYPNCQDVPGHLAISRQVSDLSPLANIRTVGTYLSINRDSQLISLNGLNNLISVAGNVRIERNLTITSLSGLENLQDIGGSLSVSNNASLPSLHGLNGLVEVAEDVHVLSNPSLTSFDGFGSLQRIGNELLISNNNSLVELQGPDQLVNVEYSLEVASNDVLTTITGFTSLQDVGRLHVSFNPCQYVDGFRNVVSAENIYFHQVDTIVMTNLQTVVENLNFPLQNLKHLEGFDMLVSVGGTMWLNNTEIAEMPDFPSLVSIGEHFALAGNDNLLTFDGMNALTTVGGDFRLIKEDYLRELNGLNALATVGGVFAIYENDSLLTIRGLQSLTTVGGDFLLRFNPSLSDCEVICDFFENGSVGGDISLLLNAGNCYSETTLRESCDKAFLGMTMIDANLALLEEPPETDIANLTPEDLMELTDERDAVCADGVSKVLLKMQFSQKGDLEFPTTSDSILLPWGDTTHLLDGDHYVFVVYTPPDTLPANGESVTFEQIAALEYPINFTFTNEEAEAESDVMDITLVRPPVVLVHGTFSNPDKAWKTAVEEGESMFQALSGAGFYVSTVDYTGTNGDTDSGPSSFEDNAMVVWDNPGGINDALLHYRDLKIAVTQADVVGHSLGGVLPRVYASENYNENYERPDNFMEGDINRLITMAATHYGSHLGELQIVMADATPFDLGPLDWLINVAQNLIVSYYTGTTASEAVRDQRPKPLGGEALDLIGATPIPSHAITASVPLFGLKDPVYDPNEEYYDLYWYTELMMYYNADIRKAYLDSKHDLFEEGYAVSTTWDGSESSYFKREIADIIVFADMIDGAILSAGKLLSVLDGTFQPPSGAQLFKWAYNELGMSDIVDIDPFIFLYEAYTNPVGVITGYVVDQIMPTEAEVRAAQESLHEKSIEGLRSLIFNNDANDGVVSVSSQRGNIDAGTDGCEECTTNFDNVLHGFAPRYADIQEHVITLLSGGLGYFNENGFPDPEEVLPLYYPPNELDLYDELIRGDDAICQSGMLPSHARAYARVADRENAIIIVRPVNPDATPVIERGAATKVMDVKPKSSNFGPQKGYLPADQRYSKIWKLFEEPTRAQQVTKYNEKVAENLGNMIVDTKQLNVEACNTRYWVYIDNNKRGGADDMCAEDEIVLVPVQNPDLVCYWGGDDVCSGLIGFSTDDNIGANCVVRGPEHDLVPFEVISTIPTEPGNPQSSQFVTADYDLLMIGFHEGEGLEYTVPDEVPFRDGVGQLTSRQESLIDKLNAEASHPGGNLTHHGPENQFKHSPYIDYPLTVFAPDATPGASGGEIISIRMGEKGFRDINLKKYINKMRIKGYDLLDNPTAPGWQWTWNEGQKGFQLDDHQDLADYVEEMPQRDCNKVGNAFPSICDAIALPNAASNEKQSSWLFPPSSQSLSVTPSLAYSDYINVNVTGGDPGLIKVIISDIYGNKRLTSSLTGFGGTISISELEQGIYTVTAIPGGISVRFVRM